MIAGFVARADNVYLLYSGSSGTLRLPPASCSPSFGANWYLDYGSAHAVRRAAIKATSLL